MEPSSRWEASPRQTSLDAAAEAAEVEQDMPMEVPWTFTALVENLLPGEYEDIRADVPNGEEFDEANEDTIMNDEDMVGKPTMDEEEFRKINLSKKNMKM